MRNKFSPMRKVLTILLTAVILVISVPITASAYMGYNISNGDVNITTGAYKHVITGSSTEHAITVNAPGQTVNITLENLDISFSEPYLKRPINIVAGTVNLTLCGHNVLKSGGGYAGICNNGNPLVIQEDMTTSFEDTLKIEDSGHGAGIGGDDVYRKGSNITIHSGYIEIHAQSGAAIGGGQGADGENILIDGGTIIADSTGGAGIGGGSAGKASNIRIAGGTITATSYMGAGIGGGRFSTASDIIIDGGSVKASSNSGIAIGGGSAAITPKNSSGDEVFLVTRASLSPDEKSYLTTFTFNYNMTGANAIDGQYYLYLPRYSITYNSDGGVHNNPNSYNILSDFTLTDAYKTNYVFKGWFYAQSGGNKLTVITPGHGGDITLYAQWTPLPVLQSISTPDAISGVTNGTAKTASALGLPTTVTLETDNGDVSASVLWGVDSCTYDVSSTAAQTFNVNGTVTLPNGVVNPNKVSLNTTINVTVLAQPVTDKVLQSIAVPALITDIANGTAKTASTLGLPMTVVLKTDNGDVNASVAWDVASCSYNAGSTTAQNFTVSGTVTLPSGVVNPNNVSLNTTINVIVLAKPVTDKVLQSITTPTAITDIANGTAKTASTLGLPMTVVLKTDNGDVNASVAWDVASCSYNAGSTTAQNFTVSGTVTLPSGVVNTNSVPLTTTISVSVKKALSGGSSSFGGSTTTKYSVSSDTSTNGTVTLSGTSVSRGGSVTITITPDRGYRIADVLINGVSVGSVSSYTIKGVSKNTTVKVGFEKVEEDNAWVNPYSDVKESAWYYDSISYVSRRGMMNGDGGQFRPDDDMSRAMVVTVLFRLSGGKGGFDNTFSDVNSGAWYEQAVAWASVNGIASGVGSDSFAPESSLSREQFAVMLYNYAKYKGLNVTMEGGVLDRYADSGNVSVWAQDAMKWAVSARILSGDGSNLDPQGSATRAEIAAMVQRLIETVSV